MPFLIFIVFLATRSKVYAASFFCGRALDGSRVPRKVLLTTILMLWFVQVSAQHSGASKSWGVFLGPHATNYRFKSGVGVSYPFNTTFSEHGSTNIFIQLYRQKSFRNNLQIETDLTFSRYKAKTVYHYDSSYPLFYRTFYEKKDVSFIGFGPGASYRIVLKNFSVSPFVSIAGNLVLKSMMQMQQEVNGSTQNYLFNVLEREKPIVVNYDLGIKFAYQAKSNLVFEIKPFYRHFLTGVYFYTIEKIFYSYGIAFGVSHFKLTPMK